MTIRQALRGDAAALVPLLAQLGYAVSESDLWLRLSQMRDAATLVAVDGERIVGVASVAVRETLTGGAQPSIEGFVVEESARSRGVGAELLAAVEAWARRRGFGSIRVQSNAVRERAHAFYLREGYAILKQSVAFEKPL